MIVFQKTLYRCKAKCLVTFSTEETADWSRTILVDPSLITPVWGTLYVKLSWELELKKTDRKEEKVELLYSGDIFMLLEQRGVDLFKVLLPNGRYGWIVIVPEKLDEQIEKAC